MPEQPTPKYLVINRFDDEFGEYHRFAEGLRCELAYLTLPAGLEVLDREGALATVVLDDLGFETVHEQAELLVREHGPFDGVVGLSERDLLTAARLREALGVPGYRPDFVRRFLDKTLMKELVGGAGLRVPHYLGLERDTTAEAVVAAIGLPVVLKPRAAAGSRGVSVCRDEAQLAAGMEGIEPGDYECEEFIEGAMYHVDGVRRGGKLHFASVSEYIDTCLGFAQGHRLGSVLIDPGPLWDQAVEFTGGCLDALGLEDGAFHLELFRTVADELVFCEVAMRPGGGEIGFIHRDVLGIDLFGEAFRAALALPPFNPPEDFAPPTGGGFVMVPEAGPLPSRVASRTPMTGVVPEVYAEVLPAVGDVFDGRGGYYLIGGRFRLRGADHRQVRKAVLAVMEAYELTAAPLEADPRGPIP